MVAAVAAVVCGSVSTKADSVTMSYINTSPNDVSTVYSAGASVNPILATAGEFNFHVTAVDNSSGGNPIQAGTDIVTFCVNTNADILNNLYNVDYAAFDPPGSDNADVLRHWYAAYFNLIGSDAARAAAFQLGIWEIVNDHDAAVWAYTPGVAGDLAVGNFRILSSPEFTLVDTWLGANFMSVDASAWKVIELHPAQTGGSQDQIYGTNIPVPAAAWMGLSTLAGLAGLGIVRRRRLS